MQITHVATTEQAIVTIKCLFDGQNFPFDTYVCTQLLRSHQYRYTSLDLRAGHFSDVGQTEELKGTGPFQVHTGGDNW